MIRWVDGWVDAALVSIRHLFHLPKTNKKSYDPKLSNGSVYISLLIYFV